MNGRGRKAEGPRSKTSHVLPQTSITWYSPKPWLIREPGPLVGVLPQARDPSDPALVRKYFATHQLATPLVFYDSYPFFTETSLITLIQRKEKERQMPVSQHHTYYQHIQYDFRE